MNLNRSTTVAFVIALLLAVGCGDDLRKKGSTDSRNNTSSSNINNSAGTNNANNTSGGVNTANNDSGGLNTANNDSGGLNTANNDSGGLNNANNNSGGLNNANNNSGAVNNANNNSGGLNNANNNSGGVNNANNLPGDDFPSIHVQLTWDTGNTDLDIHFAHPLAAMDTDQPDLDHDGEPDPWLHSTYDCNWRNKSPEWGSVGTHNPTQDIDDLDGFGPENVNLEEPEGVDYRIGVRYYSGMSAGDVPPQTVATVKVYVDGNLEYEASRTLSELDMWEIGSVDGRSGTVTPATMNAGPKVTPNYDPDLAF